MVSSRGACGGPLGLRSTLAVARTTLLTFFEHFLVLDRGDTDGREGDTEPGMDDDGFEKCVANVYILVGIGNNQRNPYKVARI